MKHIHRISQPTVQPAQAIEIIGIIGTVLSGLGAILLAVVPLISKAA